jgi:hypothetical protein
VLTADWKNCTEPGIAKQKASPEEYADEDREEALEDGVTDAHVDGDGTAEIAGDQHRAENSGSRNDVDEDTDELDDAETDRQSERESELKECPYHRCGLEEMAYGVEEHEQDGEDAENAASPK